MHSETEKLLQSESEQLSKLKQIVQQSIVEEKLIVENILNEQQEVLSPGQRISDRVASFGGSWSFIILFSLLLLVWILFNTMVPDGVAFDPFPFILMNLVLSAIAALQAPVIMMSQNRKEEKDRRQNENDYMINLKAEVEVRSLHQKMDLLLEEQIKILFDSQARQLELLKRIEEKLDGRRSDHAK
jgi:uncharacterized membrane protein